MNKIITVVIILIVIVIGGTVGVLYTQIWNPTWNPFRPAPGVVLAEMVLKMEGLKTFHNETEIEIKIENNEEVNIFVKAVGDTDQTDAENLKSKGDMDVEFSTEGVAISAGMEFITIAETSYFKLITLPNLPLFGGLDLSTMLDAVKNQWIRFDQESMGDVFEKSGIEYYQPLSEREQKELIEKLTELLKGEKFYKIEKELPDVKIGDEMTYHYLLTLEKGEIRELIPEMMETMMGYYLFSPGLSPEEMEITKEEIPEQIDEFFEKIGEITFEVWIGQKDKYLYKVEFGKEIDLSESDQSFGKVSILAEINFSRFNQSVEIEAPKDSKTLEEISQLMMEKFFMMSGFPIEGFEELPLEIADEMIELEMPQP